MPVKDLKGQKFGKLIVLERDNTKKGGAAYWICKCECGTIKSIRGSNLTSSIKPTLSCGCLAKEINSARRDLTSMIGKNFGRLTVIERDLTKPQGKGHPSYWLCKCSCGNIISAAGSELTRGSISSCGCLRKELLTLKNTKDITNQRFGMLVAKEKLEEKSPHGSFYWRCECDCGNLNYICSAENLLSGRVHSCGCNKSSMGEKIISEILTTNNINFAKEFTFSNLVSEKGNKLRYDFAIFNDSGNLIRLVEFDGEQHYNKRSPYYSEQMCNHDNLKNEYCKQNNIPLIRLPYSLLNKLSLDLIMGDEYLI